MNNNKQNNLKPDFKSSNSLHRLTTINDNVKDGISLSFEEKLSLLKSFLADTLDNTCFNALRETLNDKELENYININIERLLQFNKGDIY